MYRAKAKLMLPMLPMLAGLALLATPPATQAWERGKVETFATLPPGEAHPEGIAMDREGNVYVATVAVNKPDTSEGTLLVFDPQGKHLRTVGIKGSSRLLLDIAFHPRTGKLLVNDYKGGKVLSVDPKTGDSTVFMTVTGKSPGLNSMVFDAAGNVYVTDSHQGIIWKVGPGGGEASAWVSSPLLKPTRLPPGIGANGLAFNNSKTAMFVANTANDIIVRIPLTGLDAGAGHAGSLRAPRRRRPGRRAHRRARTTSGSRATSPTRSSCSSRRRAGCWPSSATSAASTATGHPEAFSGRILSCSTVTTFWSRTWRSILARPFRSWPTSLACRISWR